MDPRGRVAWTVSTPETPRCPWPHPVPRRAPATPGTWKYRWSALCRQAPRCRWSSVIPQVRRCRRSLAIRQVRSCCRSSVIRQVPRCRWSFVFRQVRRCCWSFVVPRARRSRWPSAIRRSPAAMSPEVTRAPVGAEPVRRVRGPAAARARGWTEKAGGPARAGSAAETAECRPRKSRTSHPARHHRRPPRPARGEARPERRPGEAGAPDVYAQKATPGRRPRLHGRRRPADPNCRRSRRYPEEHRRPSVRGHLAWGPSRWAGARARLAHPLWRLATRPTARLAVSQSRVAQALPTVRPRGQVVPRPGVPAMWTARPAVSLVSSVRRAVRARWIVRPVSATVPIGRPGGPVVWRPAAWEAPHPGEPARSRVRSVARWVPIGRSVAPAVSEKRCPEPAAPMACPAEPTAPKTRTVGPRVPTDRSARTVVPTDRSAEAAVSTARLARSVASTARSAGRVASTARSARRVASRAHLAWWVASRIRAGEAAESRDRSVAEAAESTGRAAGRVASTERPAAMPRSRTGRLDPAESGSRKRLARERGSRKGRRRKVASPEKRTAVAGERSAAAAARPVGAGVRPAGSASLPLVEGTTSSEGRAAPEGEPPEGGPRAPARVACHRASGARVGTARSRRWTRQGHRPPWTCQGRQERRFRLKGLSCLGRQSRWECPVCRSRGECRSCCSMCRFRLICPGCLDRWFRLGRLSCPGCRFQWERLGWVWGEGLGRPGCSAGCAPLGCPGCARRPGGSAGPMMRWVGWRAGRWWGKCRAGPQGEVRGVRWVRSRNARAGRSAGAAGQDRTTRSRAGSARRDPRSGRPWARWEKGGPWARWPRGGPLGRRQR